MILHEDEKVYLARLKKLNIYEPYTEGEFIFALETESMKETKLITQFRPVWNSSCVNWLNAITTNPAVRPLLWGWKYNTLFNFYYGSGADKPKPAFLIIYLNRNVLKAMPNIAPIITRAFLEYEPCLRGNSIGSFFNFNHKHNQNEQLTLFETDCGAI